MAEPENTTENTTENTATRSVEAHLKALFDRDWDALLDLYTDDVVLEDHRRFVAVPTFTGRDEMLVGSKSIVEIGARGCEPTVLEVRGDHLCLVRLRYFGRDAELVVLNVFVVDDEGRLRSSDVYEVDQDEDAIARIEEIAGS